MVHPVTLLFEEIYRDYWGIPAERKEPPRRAAKAPSWLRSRRQAARNDG